MRIDIHVHDSGETIEQRFDRIEQLLNAILHNERTIMAQFKTFDDLLHGIDEETNRISTEMAELLAEQKRTDLTEAEEAAVQERLTAITERLKAIGKDRNQPIPPTV